MPYADAASLTYRLASMRLLLFVLVCAPVTVCAQPLVPGAPASIQVAGFGNAVAEPTRAVVSFAIEGREGDVEEALDQAMVNARLAAAPGSYAFGTVGASVTVRVTFRFDAAEPPPAPE